MAIRPKPGIEIDKGREVHIEPRRYSSNGSLRVCDRCGFGHNRWIELRVQDGSWLCGECMDEESRKIKEHKPKAERHFYGYPAHGDPEPDVIFQVTMEENNSCQLVDTVFGMTLDKVGVPEFGKEARYPFDKLSPGVYYPVGSRHDGTTAGTEFEMAADIPRTTELWVQGADFYNPGDFKQLFSLSSGSGPGLSQGEWIVTAGGLPPFGNEKALYWKHSTRGPGLFGQGVESIVHQSVFDLNDGEPHHLRFVADPSGVDTSYIAIDGVIYVTADMTQMQGWNTTTVPRIQVGGSSLSDTSGNPDSSILGNIYEARISNNNSNNSYTTKDK